MPQTSPKNPEEVMVIRQVNPHVTTLSVPFWRSGILRMGGRGTLVRLASGAVAVFSPVALTPEVKKTVSSMGDLKYITALDVEHHMFLGPWNKEYPSAKVIGVEGLPEKRASQKVENVPFSVLFTAANKDTTKIDPDFDKEFDYEYVPSHLNKELVFCHKPSGTLITADYLMNLPANEQFSKAGESPSTGILTKLFISLYNTQGAALGQKRMLWHVASRSDREGFNKSAAKINSWNFDTVIPCHGDVVDTGGKGLFQKLFEWHLETAKRTTN